MKLGKSAVSAVALVAIVTFGFAAVSYAASEAKARVRHLIGTVASVNEEAKTVSITRSVKGKTQELTFGVEKDAVTTLAHLKPGERVRISYVDHEGRMMAQSIKEVTHAAQK